MLNASNRQTFAQNSAYHNLIDIMNPRSKSITKHHCFSILIAMYVSMYVRVLQKNDPS